MFFDSMGIFYLVLGITVAFLVFIIRSLYWAFFKAKDERAKWIVTRTMAQCFVVVGAVSFLHLILAFAANDMVRLLSSYVGVSLQFEPFFAVTALFGVLLLVNRKRYGG